ncbi:MAG: hypothetical protein KDK50_04160, partial [Chlamydiia bacterium]|nr:hypothetical protein [Chlamydiia bacterium]
CYSVKSIKDNYKLTDPLEKDRTIQNIAQAVIFVKIIGAAIAARALLSACKSTSIIGWNRVALSPVSIALNVLALIVAHDCVIIAQNIFEHKKHPVSGLAQGAVDATAEVVKRAATDAVDTVFHAGKNFWNWFSGAETPSTQESSERTPNEESYVMVADKKLYESILVRDTIAVKPILFYCLRYEKVQKVMAFTIRTIVGVSG